MSNNDSIARNLMQISALLDEQGVAFKPAAYRRAAQVVKELSQDVSLYGDAKELKKLPGIGDAIANKIIEFLETGEMEFLEKLKLEQGGISGELMDIEGLGPKRVRLIQDELGIKTIAQFIKAAEAGKLAPLERFDTKLEKKVLENAKKVKERNTRFKRSNVEDDVKALIRSIKKVKGVEQCEVAGSFRRKKATVGDIDILVVTKKPHEVADAVSRMKLVRDVVAHGDKKVSFDTLKGLRVDVRFVSRDQWGSALMYFTGSKEHNIAMRKKAIGKRLKLSEYGLFDGEDVVASETEEEIYTVLELPYYEPEDREGGL